MRLRTSLCLTLIGLALFAASVLRAQDEAATPASTSEIQIAIDQTRADIAALEAIEQRWTAEEETEGARLETMLERVLTLQSQLQDADPRSAEVEQIFDRLKPLVRVALDTLDAVLDSVRRPSEVGQDRRSGGGTAHLGRSGTSQLSRTESAELLEDLQSEEDDLRDELGRREIERRLDRVNHNLELAGQIWSLRNDLLPLLPKARKTAVYSFSGEGLEEIDLELDALRLVGEVQLLRLEGAWFIARRGVVGFISAFKLGTLFIKLAFVFLLFRWVSQSRLRYLERARVRVRTIEDPEQRLRATTGVEFVASVAPWGLFLLTVLFAYWLIGEPMIDFPLVKPIFTLLFIYGVYRLVSDLAVGLLADAMRRAGVEVSDDLRGRIASRVQWVIRILTLGWVVLALLSIRLGEGVLYSHIRGLTWILAAIVLVVGMGTLRSEVAEMYLATRASGGMARLVRKTRDTFAGRLVAPVAFVVLVLISFGSLLRGLFFSMERTRVATAYMARRRLQKAAALQGYATGDLSVLPTEVVNGFASTLTVGDLEALGRFEGMDVIEQALELWREGEGGGSFLLAGDEGVGKRAWVSRFVEKQGVELRIEPERRIMNGKALIRWLGRNLLDEDESLTRAQLVSRIEDGPARIIVIERAERLFLGTVNGYHALAELGPIVDATRHHLFWVVSMGGLAFRHLTAARKDLAFLRRQQLLTEWRERELQELIDFRLAECGQKVDYSRLLATDSRHEDRKARDRHGRTAYVNLLWDYAGGNPKAALHYYLHSLEPGKDGFLAVRPFIQPDEAELEAIDESALFILAAIGRHGSLTPREVARATDYSVGRVSGRLVRLQDLDVVVVTSGAYRITTEWRSTVLRVLRRHNILTH